MLLNRRVRTASVLPLVATLLAGLSSTACYFGEVYLDDRAPPLPKGR